MSKIIITTTKTKINEAITYVVRQVDFEVRANIKCGDGDLSGVDSQVDGAAVLDPHLGDPGPVLVQHRPLPSKICMIASCMIL